MTEITATTAGSVVVTDAGNHLAEVTPSPIDLPIAGDVNAFYEAREGMKVTFVDTLTVSEYFELARFGQIILFEGGRPQQFTETDPPSVAGYAAHLDDARPARGHPRRRQQRAGGLPQPARTASQSVFYPRANGGFSVGTQGTDFFRGGDLVNGLTGVLHWSFPGFGADTWRIRPTAANPATFTVANPRPATPPAVGGAIKAVGMNLLNYFTTIDTTGEHQHRPCGPSGTPGLPRRRQRRRAQPPARARLDRHLHAERRRLRLHGAREHHPERHDHRPARRGQRPLRRRPSVRLRRTPAARSAPTPSACSRSTAPASCRRSARRWSTSIRSTTGRRRRRRSTSSTPPTRRSASASRSIANHFKSKGCDAPATGADADSGDGQSCYNGRAHRAGDAAADLDQQHRPAGRRRPRRPAARRLQLLREGRPGHARSRPAATPISRRRCCGPSVLLVPVRRPARPSRLRLRQREPRCRRSPASATGTSTPTRCRLFDYNDEVFDSPGEATLRGEAGRLGARAAARRLPARHAVPRLRSRPGARRPVLRHHAARHDHRQQPAGSQLQRRRNASPSAGPTT